MKILKTSLANPDIKVIEAAVNILKNGGLVVYPTDTAYGLGGNALSEGVIKKVYKVKERDFGKPTHVIVKNWGMIRNLTEPTNLSKPLFKKLFPGPITIILKKKKIIPDILTANMNTLGIRIPDCKITKLISEKVDFPYTTPSANRSEKKTPYSVSEVIKGLKTDLIDLIIDCGRLPQKDPSTIIDLSCKPFRILREGSMDKKILNDALEGF